MKLFDIIFKFSRIRDRANKIKADEECRPRSAYCAVCSIVLTLIGASAAVGGLYVALSIGESLGVLMMLLLSIALFAVAAVALAWSVVYLVFQFGINRSAWSFIALGVLAAALAGAAVVALTVF